MDSILTSIKLRVGVSADDDSYDIDIIDLINGAFADLYDIGVGPSTGFSIADQVPTWEQFTSDVRILSSVKDFVYLSVKLIFDPPTQAALLASMERRLDKLEWRLSAKNIQ